MTTIVPQSIPVTLKDLPFVRDSKGKKRCFWSPPRTGDWCSDITVGEHLAALAKAYMRQTNCYAVFGWIVADMPRGDLTGVEVGFLSAFSRVPV